MLTRRRSVLEGTVLLAGAVAVLAGCGRGFERVPGMSPGPPAVDLLGGWASGREEREAVSVRPGDPSHHRSLLAGWGRPENATGEVPSAWVIGTAAEVELVLLDEGFTTLHFRCRPMSFDAGPEQAVSVELNGSPLGQVRLGRRLASYELRVPPGCLRLGRNRLRLGFAWAEAPADHQPGSRDRRRLAAAFELIELTGGGPAAPGRGAGPGFAEADARSLEPGSARVFRVGLPPSATLDVALDPDTPEDLWGEVWVSGEGGGPVRLGRVGPGAGGGPSRRIDLGVRGTAAADLWLVARSGGSGPGARLRWRRAVLSGSWGGLDVSSNVVLVVVDTLRADHVGCYGSTGATPTMDAISAAGVRFANAYCQVPTTGPSHASLFTSLPPTGHGVRANAQQVPSGLDTLAETLHMWHRHTAGFVSLGVLKGEWGFSQGFDTYEGSFPLDWFKDAREVTDGVLDWLARSPSEPFFLWVHYSDPHEPYTPPDRTYPRVAVRIGTGEVAGFSADGRTVTIPVTLEPGTTVMRFEPGEPPLRRRLEVFNLRLAAGEGCRVEARDGWWRDPNPRGPSRLSTALPATVALVNPGPEPRPVEVRFYSKELLSTDETRDRYRAEVGLVDRELGRLLRDLEARGSLERTLLVLTSDHGESLGEHHHVGHTSQLYEPLLRVPLLMSFPGRLPEGVVVEQRVTLLDVVPTVHGLLGLPTAEGALGRSLVPLTRGADLDERPVLAATYRPEAPSDLRSLLLGRWKLIAHLEPELRAELYDTTADPGELVDLAELEPEELARLLAEMDAEPDGPCQSPETSPAAVELSDEEAAQMRALGYVR